MSRDQLTYLVNNSKLAQPFKLPLTKTPFKSDIMLLVKAAAYLMECSLCEKSKYVGKSKYSLNLRMNTHRNNVWRTDGPPRDKHFQMPGHNFNINAKFTR